MDIDTLHFLVHPGLSLMVDHRRKYMKSMFKLSDSEKQAEAELIVAYRKKIDTFGENDVLVIFSPEHTGSYRKTLKEERVLKEERAWMSTERYARAKLGRRCIALSNPDFLGSFEKEASFDTVDTLLSGRGFKLKKSTKCEVWGVSARICVIDTAEEVFKHFKFEEFPVIPAEATNLRFMGEENITELEKDLKKKHPRARIANRI